MPSDHDGHTINVGPVTVGKTLAKPIDTDAIRDMYRPKAHPYVHALCAEVDRLTSAEAEASMDNDRLRAERDEAQMEFADALREVDRLRAENAALAAALEDIAGMLPTEDPEVDPERWVATGDCAGMNHVCHMEHPEDPDEWCPTCVAEIAWCAWKMGGLG